MKAILLLLLGLAGYASAWTKWTEYWTRNPGFHVNTSLPAAYRPLVAQAAIPWKWAGGYHYPSSSGATTGRDCGAGDGGWFGDDDDGYNVVDWWTKCNENSAYNDLACGTGAGKNLAWTYLIDKYNGTSEIAEVDIVMCSNVAFSSEYDGPERSFQGWLTHEMGHAVGMGHSNKEFSKATMNAGSTGTESIAMQSLGWDDVAGIRDKYPGCPAWTLTQTSGLNVQMLSAPGCGVQLKLNMSPQPNPVWTAPVTAYNASMGGWVRTQTELRWEQYDRDHSLIITLMVMGTDGVVRELNYARNAYNWWPNPGWVDMSPSNYVFNSWASYVYNIYTNYYQEYGFVAKKVEGIYVKHFAYTGWSAGDHGGTVQNLRIERGTP